MEDMPNSGCRETTLEYCINTGSVVSMTAEYGAWMSMGVPSSAFRTAVMMWDDLLAGTSTGWLLTGSLSV